MICLCVKSISGTVVDKWTLQGDTITLHCDVGSGATRVEWNFIHLNEPKSTSISQRYAPPPFKVLENSTLRIENITGQEFGLYYCSGVIDGSTDVKGMIYKVSFQGKHDSISHRDTIVCGTTNNWM